MAFSFAPPNASAAEAAAPLEVRVNYVADKTPEIGLCRASEAGSTATVICSPAPTPAPPASDRRVHFSNVRFYLSGAGNWLGDVDESTGAGTVTSWRVIRLSNRDYLELMVGW